MVRAGGVKVWGILAVVLVAVLIGSLAVFTIERPMPQKDEEPLWNIGDMMRNPVAQTSVGHWALRARLSANVLREPRPVDLLLELRETGNTAKEPGASRLALSIFKAQDNDLVYAIRHELTFTKANGAGENSRAWRGTVQNALRIVPVPGDNACAQLVDGACYVVQVALSLEDGRTFPMVEMALCVLEEPVCGDVEEVKRGVWERLRETLPP